MGKSNVNLIKHTFFANPVRLSNSERSDTTSDPFGKNVFSFQEEDFSLDELCTEFSSLQQLFLSNKQTWSNDNPVILYMDYLCELMIRYYQHDYVSSNLLKLEQQRQEIEAFLRKECSKLKEEPIDDFLKRLRTHFEEYAFSFISISELRKYVGNLNSRRSQFTYSRALASIVITYLQKSFIAEFIDEINKILSNPYGFTECIDFLNRSRKTIADLGIVLYGVRFFINFILTNKHVIQSATNKQLSAKKVLQQEMEKRGFVMASDLVWSTIGLLTVYNNFFHITASVVPTIIVSFLIFDTLLLFAQWFFEISKYNEHIQDLNAQKKDATPFEKVVIQRQIDVLNDEWEAQCAYYAINILGANILATCFAISMLCTGPLVLAGVALFSMLGNALYNTSEAYKNYQKTKIAVRREVSNGEMVNDAHHQELLKELKKVCDKNYIQFCKTLAFNVGGIAFIITAAAASWPIALGLTLIYAVYCLHDAYQKQLTKNEEEEVTPDIYRIL